MNMLSVEKKIFVISLPIQVARYTDFNRAFGELLSYLGVPPLFMGLHQSCGKIPLSSRKV
jgi:hypothetical protein